MDIINYNYLEVDEKKKNNEAEPEKYCINCLQFTF